VKVPWGRSDHGDLIAVGLLPSAFGAHGEHVLLDGQVDGGRFHAGQIEVHDRVAGMSLDRLHQLGEVLTLVAKSSRLTLMAHDLVTDC
jgi:hypothetical protein